MCANVQSLMLHKDLGREPMRAVTILLSIPVIASAYTYQPAYKLDDNLDVQKMNRDMEELKEQSDKQRREMKKLKEKIEEDKREMEFQQSIQQSEYEHQKLMNELQSVH
jgi:uncharacterized membrane protein (DUF106 family)